MDMLNYLALAGGAWFVGFFPLFEIVFAVPAALASGLDAGSVIFWTVLGNFTPIVLIHFGYEQLMQIERVRGWLNRLISEKMQQQINKYGIWVVLLLTPWTGVWVMAVTAKVLRMRPYRFMSAAFISITAYAILLVILINTGSHFINAAA